MQRILILNFSDKNSGTLFGTFLALAIKKEAAFAASHDYGKQYYLITSPPRAPFRALHRWRHQV